MTGPINQEIDAELARHAAALERQLAVEALADEMMRPGGECYPYKLESIIEALSSIDHRAVGVMAAAAALRLDSDAGMLLSKITTEYWRNVAMERADDRI
jgi:hypothetical protein